MLLICYIELVCKIFSPTLSPVKTLHYLEIRNGKNGKIPFRTISMYLDDLIFMEQLLLLLLLSENV